MPDGDDREHFPLLRYAEQIGDLILDPV